MDFKNIKMGYKKMGQIVNAYVEGEIGDKEFKKMIDPEIKKFKNRFEVESAK